jgi:hypothetical protein
LILKMSLLNMRLKYERFSKAIQDGKKSLSSS